jgi:hypothetical protein
MQVQIKVDRAFVNAQHYYIKAKSAALDHWKKAKERFQAANDLNFLFTTPVDLAELKTIAEPCASELIIKGDLYKQLKKGDAPTITDTMMSCLHYSHQVCMLFYHGKAH